MSKVPTWQALAEAAVAADQQSRDRVVRKIIAQLDLAFRTRRNQAQKMHLQPHLFDLVDCARLCAWLARNEPPGSDWRAEEITDAPTILACAAAAGVIDRLAPTVLLPPESAPEPAAAVPPPSVVLRRSVLASGGGGTAG